MPIINQVLKDAGKLRIPNITNNVSIVEEDNKLYQLNLPYKGEKGETLIKNLKNQLKRILSPNNS